MIESATERRLAGDWIGACRVARVEPLFTLSEVRKSHGPGVAERLEQALLHFSPDLLRWHLPRNGATTVLESLGWVPLLRLTEADREGLANWLCCGLPALQAPQRLTLSVVQLDVRRCATSFDLCPEYWDVRYCHHLAKHCVPQIEPIARLQDKNDYEEAWRLSGLTAIAGEATARDWKQRRPRWWWQVSWSRLLGEARRWVASRGVARGLLVPVSSSPKVFEWSEALLIESLGEGQAPTLRPFPEAERSHGPKHPTPAVPIAQPLWQRPPDFDLLRFGLIQPEHLHPLVYGALWPHAKDSVTPLGPPPGELAQPVRIFCSGKWHLLEPRDGRYQATEHPPEQARREAVLSALGGKPAGCFCALQALYEGRGRLPKVFREQLRDFRLCIIHGDWPEVKRWMDSCLGANFRGRNGKTLLHYLPYIGLEHLPFLLASGLDINAPGEAGRTLLHVMVELGATVTEIQTVIAAGANPQIVDQYGVLPGDIARWLSVNRRDLAFLPSKREYQSR